MFCPAAFCSSPELTVDSLMMPVGLYVGLPVGRRRVSGMSGAGLESSSSSFSSSSSSGKFVCKFVKVLLPLQLLCSAAALAPLAPLAMSFNGHSNSSCDLESVESVGRDRALPAATLSARGPDSASNSTELERSTLGNESS